MDFRQLRYAVELGRTMHFTRAAERLGVAQPAFSHAIAQLERDLGVTLFVRNSRSVQLTTAGRLFVDRAEELLREIDALRLDMHEHAQSLRGRIAVGTMVFFFFGEPRLAALIAEFCKIHPMIDVTLDNFTVQDNLEALRQGRIDLALLNVTTNQQHADLDFLVVDQDEIVVALPPGHRLAARRRIRFDELAGEAFVRYAAGSTMHDALNELARTAGFTPRSTVQSRNIILVRALVSAGAGVSIGPLTYLSAPGPPVEIVFLTSAPTVAVTMVTRAKADANPAARALISFLRDRFGG